MFLVVALMAVGVVSAAPQQTRPRSAEMVSVNFNHAELAEVIHVLAQHLKLAYAIDPEVKGMATIHSSEPVKREDLFPIFHQILRMNGAAAVKVGEMYRIMSIRDGKGLARPVEQKRAEGYALQVVSARFFSVSEMTKLLSPFVTAGGEILDYARENFLIVVDLPSNIERLMGIRDLIDVNAFAGLTMEIYQPKGESTEDLALDMGKVMQAYAPPAAQAGGFAAQLLPIPRVNQLLVISRSEAAWMHVKRWLERVDQVAEGSRRRIFIYPVENGKATELARMLSESRELGRSRIIADPVTNTLIIYSTAQEFEEMRSLVEGDRSEERFKQQLLTLSREIRRSN